MSYALSHPRNLTPSPASLFSLVCTLSYAPNHCSYSDVLVFPPSASTLSCAPIACTLIPCLVFPFLSERTLSRITIVLTSHAFLPSDCTLWLSPYCCSYPNLLPGPQIVRCSVLPAIPVLGHLLYLTSFRISPSGSGGTLSCSPNHCSRADPFCLRKYVALCTAITCILTTLVCMLSCAPSRRLYPNAPRLS